MATKKKAKKKKAPVQSMVPGDIVLAPITVELRAGGAREKAAIARIRAALKAHDGVILYACEDLGVTRYTVFKWLALYPALNEYARKLRADSGEHEQRIANARTSRLMSLMRTK
jgi:hypothetical protein